MTMYRVGFVIEDLVRQYPLDECESVAVAVRTLERLDAENIELRRERDAALAELARLREVERLAVAYRAAVMGRRAHKGVDPYTDDSPLGMKWGRRMEELTTVKRAAGEALFAALDKETTADG